MCSEGTVVGFVCLSVRLKLTCSKVIRSTNDTAYLMHHIGEKVCGIFSETAPLQISSTASVEGHTYV